MMAAAPFSIGTVVSRYEWCSMKASTSGEAQTNMLVYMLDVCVQVAIGGLLLACSSVAALTVFRSELPRDTMVRNAYASRN